MPPVWEAVVLKAAVRRRKCLSHELCSSSVLSCFLNRDLLVKPLTYRWKKAILYCNVKLCLLPPGYHTVKYISESSCTIRNLECLKSMKGDRLPAVWIWIKSVIFHDSLCFFNYLFFYKSRTEIKWWVYIQLYSLSTFFCWCYFCIINSSLLPLCLLLSFLFEPFFWKVLYTMQYQ